MKNFLRNLQNVTLEVTPMYYAVRVSGCGEAITKIRRLRGGLQPARRPAGIHEKGKPPERTGRKTRGLRRLRYGSPVAGVFLYFFIYLKGE